MLHNALTKMSPCRVASELAEGHLPILTENEHTVWNRY